MSGFERTRLGDVKRKIDDGVGFVVGDHNFGRVDRMSEVELTTVAQVLIAHIGQAGLLLDAIGMETERRAYGQSA